MNLRDLKYLIALTDYRHFGKAAEACFVSQPALSMQIKKLEDTLGVQLLERTNKSVLLTDIGHRIAQKARDILNQVEVLRDIAKQAKDPFSGEFNLGAIPTLAPYLLPHIVPGLSAAFPRLTIYLVEEKTTDLMDQLFRGKLDAALLALPITEEELTAIPLFEEEFLLATPKNHALSKRKIVKPSDLTDSALLLLADGHCMREQALSFCQSAKASESKHFQATSLETLRHMVAANVGITLMPTLSCRKNDGICYLPFHSPKPIRTIGMVSRKTNAKQQLLREMMNQIKKLMQKSELVLLTK